MKKIKFLVLSGIFFFSLLLCGLALTPFTNGKGQCPNETVPTKTLESFQAVEMPKNLVEPIAPLSLVNKATTLPKTTADEVAPGGMAIAIPKIGVNAQVIAVGLESNKELHVPSNSIQAGLYKYGSQPGETGVAVITGHMDFGKNFAPAVFYNLNKLKTGDEIYVTRDDGLIAVYSINTLEQYFQNNFPTQKVYGQVQGSELRLITCAGSFDKSTGRYTQDLVVFAELSRIIPT